MTDENSTPVTPVPGETAEQTTADATPVATDVEVSPETTVVVQDETAKSTPVEEVPTDVHVDTVESTPVEETTVIEDTPVYRRPLFMIIGVIVLLALLVFGLLGLRSCIADNNELGVAGRMIDPPADPTPAVPNGVQSWTEYKVAADALDADEYEGNIMYDSLGLLHPEQGDIREAVASMATLEQSGKTFLYVAPLGATYINTDYRVVDGVLDYRFFEDVTKDDKTQFLTFADGTVAVKAGCANAVRFHKTVPAVAKPSASTPTSPPPTSTEVKGDDTTGGAARQDLQDENAVKTNTPGYNGGTGTSGPAEAVSAKQNAGGDTTANNGQAGYAGTGSGGNTGSGTNGSGETNEGGGATDETHAGDSTSGIVGDVE